MSFNNYDSNCTSGHVHHHAWQLSEREHDNSEESAQMELRVKYPAADRAAARANRTSMPRINKRTVKRHCLVLLFAWLFMNTDPGYSQRVIASMMATRLLKNVLTKGGTQTTRPQFRLASLAGYNGGGGGFFGGHSAAEANKREGGMNAVEAIALIHALNGGRQATGGQQMDLGALLESHAPSTRAPLVRRPTSAATNAVATRQQVADDRRLAPLPPVAAVIAAVAAFLAAVAAGAAPIAAVAAAVAALLAALVAAFLAAVIVVPARKNAPLIKKLVIKKTVLPFVIPIPIKKKEKEIVYIPKPVHYHHKEHHHHEMEHHEEYKHKHKYKKHKKADYDGEPDASNLEELPMGDPAQMPPVLPPPPQPHVLNLPPLALDTDGHDLAHNNLNKIHSLLSEQDRIQSMMDEVVEQGAAK